MANPFDQFDQQSAGPAKSPFDRFDKRELSPAGKMLASNPWVAAFNAIRSVSPDVADWMATRGIGAGAALAGAPRATGDLVQGVVNWAGQKTGVDPALLMRGLPAGVQVAPAIRDIAPSADTLRRGALDVLDQREVNLPGTVGKIVDAGVEAGIGGAPFGPGAIIPSAIGGAASETAGHYTKDTPWEVWARLAGGLAGAGAGAFGQAALTRPAATATAPTPDRKAAEVIAKSLGRDKVSPAAAEEQLAALGPEGMIADIGGRNMRGKVALTANTPGAGQEIFEKALTGRKGGEGSRVEALMSDTFGKRMAATMDDLKTQRSQEAAPLYKKAFEAGTASDDAVANQMSEIVRASMGLPPVRYGATSERAREFLADPIMQQGVRKGLEIQRLEALAAGKPFNPKDYGITGFTEAGDPILKGVPNMRLLDAGKRGLDDILEQYRDKVTGKVTLDERGRAIDQVRRSYLKALDDINPDYAAARASWAGPSQALDAMYWGKAIMGESLDPYTVAKRYTAMNDTEKLAARIGVADWARQIAGETRRGSQTQRIYGDTNATLNNQAERLKIIFGADFPKIQKLAENEAVFNRTLKLLSGSRTQPLAEEGADLGGMLRTGVNASYGSPTAWLDMANRAVNWGQARMGVGSEAVREAMAKMATARTPEEKAAAMRLISEAFKGRQSGAMGRAGAALGQSVVPTLLPPLTRIP